MALLFEDAAKAKDAIMASQQKEIAKLYDDWANDIAERAKFYSHKTNASAPLSERYYKELYKQMKATGQVVSDEISGIIKSNMYTIADSVVAENVKWLQSFGFSPDGLNAAFSYVPHDVVQRLITGQVYQGGWNLSQRIWSDNQQTQKDIYQVMARGLAEQKSIYDIAKDLESYVRPGAKKSWNPILAMKNTKTGEIEYKRIYKKQVDYNAQRLARTLAQHTYQQSFIATTKDNPFIMEYIWHSNGSRVCELCMSRDGVHFKKNELPMDHPNGMCTMEPAVAEDMNDKLVEWFNSPDGTFPEIDEFAGNFGYEAKTVKTAQDFVNKYGMSNKSPNAWFNSLTQVQKAEAKMLKEQSGLGWNEWYEQNVHSTGDPTQDFVKKYGTSTKSPNAWFNSLTPEQKAEAKLLKEQSGLTWNDWYNKNVYAGSKTAATATATKTTAAAASKTVKAFNDVQDKYLSPYGFSPDNMPKNFDDWSHKISHTQAGEILKSMGTSWSDPHPYQQLMKYYNANLTNANFVDKAADTIKATKAASETLSEKDVVKILKSGKWDDINSVSKMFAEHGFDIDIFFDDDSETFDTDSYLFKEASKQIFGKNTAAKAATTATKTAATATKVTSAANKIDNVFNADLWRKSMSENNLAEINDWTKDWLATISPSEKRGVVTYTGSAYWDMNAYLRGQQSGTSYKKAIEECKSALSKASLPRETIVRRGADFNMLDTLGIGKITPDNKSSVIGAIVQDKGFMSTSPAPQGGFTYMNIEYVIKLPQGTQAMYVDSISKHKGEQELLINCGGKFMVEDVEFGTNGNVKKIYMTLTNLQNK